MVLLYSSNQLWALKPSSRLALDTNTYHRLRELGISCVQPTHRGLRSRPHKQNHITQERKHKHTQLKMSLLNTRSVCNKAVLLCEHIVDKNLDVFLMTETWLKESDSLVINDLCPEGYAFMGESRSSNARGGGVGIVFRDSLSQQITRESQGSYKTFEAMTFKVRGKPNILCTTIYRPPSSSIPLFFY